MTSTISIPVDPATARNYEQASVEVQKRIQTAIREQLEAARRQKA